MVQTEYTGRERAAKHSLYWSVIENNFHAAVLAAAKHQGIRKKRSKRAWLTRMDLLEVSVANKKRNKTAWLMSMYLLEVSVAMQSVKKQEQQQDSIIDMRGSD